MHYLEAQPFCRFNTRLKPVRLLHPFVRVLVVFLVAAVPGPLAAPSAAAATVPGPKPSTPIAPRMPLRFEACLPVTCGQSRNWSYIGLGGSYRVLLATNKIAIVQPRDKGKSAQTTILELMGPSAEAKVVAGDRLGSEGSYFSGGDPKQWHSHVPDYSSVTLHGVYAGVDLRFYESGQQIEFDIQGEPGADLNQLKLHIVGGNALVLDNGDLKLGEGDTALRIHIPAAYQIDNNNKVPVAATFSTIGKDLVQLRTGQLQNSLPTVVDPTVAFSTLLAAPDANNASDAESTMTNVAVDGSGNIWVAGTTYGPLPDLSTNPVLTCSSCKSSFGYDAVAYAAKFDPSGNLLVVVELGGTTDLMVAMALDQNGNVYLAGNTNGRQNPTTSGAYDTRPPTGANYKIFISKIDPMGSNLIFSTLLGGTTGSTNIKAERGASRGVPGAIQVDDQGNVWVGGSSGATDFPVTANAVQSDCGPGVCTGGYANGILAELSSDGSKLLYGTFLGGSGVVCATACYDGGDISQIALSSGKVLVTGSTTSLNFPVSPTAIHRTNSECGGAGAYSVFDSNFLASIDPTQSRSSGLVFST